MTDPILAFEVDFDKAPWEQKVPCHNRWHPEIPPAAKLETGEQFKVHCMEWTGGQIVNNDSAEDMLNVDLSAPHFLSGPFFFSDKDGVPAHPGDLLVVDILDIGTVPGQNWGFTGIFDRENGGGFLTDHFPNACKAIWDFEGIWATSRHIPGVRFPGLIHPGLIGTAPSQELLDMWNTRESALQEEGHPLMKHLHARPLACLPNPTNCLLGGMSKDDPKFATYAAEAARTIPGRENGGNCDVKNLTRGSKVYFPVFVEGANLSVGDLHFSQGDGEISFCGAIEMAGFITMKAEIMRGGMKHLTPVGPSPLNVNPIFEISPLDGSRWYSEWLVFEGLSIDEDGKQHFLDASIAYKRASLNAINYISSHTGLTKEQVYMLLSCCPCEGRVSGIVDVPNACCTIAVPLGIFDVDIRPKAEDVLTGPRVVDRGQVPMMPYAGSLPTRSGCGCGGDKP